MLEHEQTFGSRRPAFCQRYMLRGHRHPELRIVADIRAFGQQPQVGDQG